MEGEGAIWHGGDLGEARRLFPNARAPWIDLSTGINPIAYPVPPLPAESVTRLPAPGDLAALEAAAAHAYGIADVREVVAAPGTQLLISLLPRLVEPTRVAIVGPTYAEHAVAWRHGGHAVAEVADIRDGEGAEVLVVVSPNNPDGRRWPADGLAALGAARARAGRYLVVDAAFADLETEPSIAPTVPDGTVVLRSFGKTYGLAGLRLGFALACPAFADVIRAALGPWPVAGPAIAIGRAALADDAWLAGARRGRAADAARLDALLAPHADGPPVGTVLFRTIRTARAPALFTTLGEAGLWVRRFRHDPHLLRLGLPPDEAAWARLAAALG